MKWGQRLAQCPEEKDIDTSTGRVVGRVANQEPLPTAVTILTQIAYRPVNNLGEESRCRPDFLVGRSGGQTPALLDSVFSLSYLCSLDAPVFF